MKNGKANLDNKLKNNESFKIMWNQFNKFKFPENFEISDEASRVVRW